MMTLAELLMAMSVGGVLVAGACRITSIGWQQAARALRRAHETQQLVLVRRGWRRLVHDSAPESWEVQETEFAAGSVTLLLRDGTLVETRDDAGRRRQRLLPVPKGATVRFTREQHPGQADTAVLWLTWEVRGRKTSHPVRIAACAQGAVSDKT